MYPLTISWPIWYDMLWETNSFCDFITVCGSCTASGIICSYEQNLDGIKHYQLTYVSWQTKFLFHSCESLQSGFVIYIKEQFSSNIYPLINKSNDVICVYDQHNMFFFLFHNYVRHSQNTHLLSTTLCDASRIYPSLSECTPPPPIEHLECTPHTPGLISSKIIYKHIHAKLAWSQYVWNKI